MKQYTLKEIDSIIRKYEYSDDKLSMNHDFVQAIYAYHKANDFFKGFTLEKATDYVNSSIEQYGLNFSLEVQEALEGMQDRYYFYNGFETPREIDLNNGNMKRSELLFITDDVTDEMLEQHELIKEQSDRDYNNQMFNDFNILRNPTLEELQLINTNIYALDKNEYLKGVVL